MPTNFRLAQIVARRRHNVVRNKKEAEEKKNAFVFHFIRTTQRKLKKKEYINVSVRWLVGSFISSLVRWHGENRNFACLALALVWFVQSNAFIIPVIIKCDSIAQRNRLSLLHSHPFDGIKFVAEWLNEWMDDNGESEIIRFCQATHSHQFVL